MKIVTTQDEYDLAVAILKKPEKELLSLYESLTCRHGFVCARREILAKLLSENLGRKKIYHIRTLWRYDNNLIKNGLIFRKTVTNKFEGINKSRTVIITCFEKNLEKK